MPRSIKRNAEMRAAAQASILNSAMTLFAQNGYAHTTTRKIAVEARVSIGLMYHYYESKEKLLRAVFDNCMAILNQEFATAYEQSSPPNRLATLLQAMFDLLTRDAAFWALFYMLRTQPAIIRVLGDDFRMWTQRLRDLFEAELKKAGRSDPGLDALILYSLIEGTIQQYLLNPATYPLDRVVERIISQFGRSQRS